MKKGILIVFILAFLSTDNFACDCSPWTLELHFNNADIIFYAKVTGINDDKREGYKESLHFILDPLYTLKGGYHPELKILETIKGEFKEDLIVNDRVDFNSRWTNCDIFFNRDARYVILLTRMRMEILGQACVLPQLQ
ncbi:MAG: hypothetical protein HC811_05835 [Flammeovirgaceae bacterium]|nr:hypothetical protein [Flammeovirgaceae bacterium]